MNKLIFCFGSNEAGIHGAGAAQHALENHGAIWGKGWGHHGNSFAIPTKSIMIRTLPITKIARHVRHFMEYAEQHPELDFQVTRIGCGLAGYQDRDIAPMFLGAPLNCQFDSRWEYILGDRYTYWGSL